MLYILINILRRLRRKYRPSPAGFFAAMFLPILFSGLSFRQDVNAVNEES